MHIHAMCGKDISASISVVDVSKNSNSRPIRETADDAEEGKASLYARVDCIASDDAEVLTSGAYRNGFCMCSTSLKSREQERARERQQGSGKDSGKKKRGSTRPFHLQAGDYTVVLSAYTPESVGNFALTFATTAGTSSGEEGGGKVRHMRKYFTVKEIPAEGWGLKRLSVSGAWKCQDDFCANPIYFLYVSAPHIATVFWSHCSLPTSLYLTFL